MVSGESLQQAVGNKNASSSHERYVKYARDKLRLTPEDSDNWAKQRVDFDANHDAEIASAKKAYTDLVNKALPNASNLTISDKVLWMQDALARVREDHRAIVPGAASEDEAISTIRNNLRQAYPKEPIETFQDLVHFDKKQLAFQSTIKTWTPEYVREEHTRGDAEITEKLKSGDWSKAEDAFKKLANGHEMLEAYKSTAKAAGIEPPALYIVKKDEEESVSASTATTKEGHKFVLISEGSTHKLTIAEQRQMWAHELNHMKNKDTTSEDIAKTHNEFEKTRDIMIYHKKEFAADAGAARDLGDPQMTINMLKKLKSTDQEWYLKKNPEKKLDDYTREHATKNTGDDHPSFDDRIKAVEALIKDRSKDKSPAVSPDKPSPQSQASTETRYMVAEVDSNGPPLQTPVLRKSRSTTLPFD